MIKNLLTNLSKLTEKNMHHLDRIDITIYNPTTVSKHFLRPTIYEASLVFDNHNRINNTRVYKTLNSNSYEDLLIQLKNYIENEIKL